MKARFKNVNQIFKYVGLFGILWMVSVNAVSAADSALMFGGGYDQVACSPGTNIYLTDAFTVEAWIKPSSFGIDAFMAVLEKSNIKISLVENHDIIANHSLCLSFIQEDSNGDGEDDHNYFFTLDGSIRENRWQHVAITYDGAATVKIYIDGIEQAISTRIESTTIDPPATDLDMYIGNSRYQARGFDGIIYDVRVWDVVRSSTEIEDNMYTPLLGAETGLAGYWKMDDGSGNVVADYTGHGISGTILGATWLSAEEMVWEMSEFHRAPALSGYLSGSDTVVLNWLPPNDSAGLTGYDVYTVESGNETLLASGVTDTTHTISGLGLYQFYSYYIQSVYSDSSTVDSNVVEFYPHASPIYVDISKSGASSETGESWENAFVNLRDALAVARSGDEIWVAQGVYTPDLLLFSGTSTGNRYSSFEVPNGVSVYGGFSGSETALGGRNPSENVTILSGDIGVADDRSDNTIHIVCIKDEIGPERTTTIDGFTIRDAQSPEFGAFDGGGIHINGGKVILSNLNILNNNASYYGGGVFALSADVGVTDVLFHGNSAANAGGGMYMYLDHSSGTFSRVQFIENTATGSFYSRTAGGLYLQDGNFQLDDVLFEKNVASLEGGGMKTIKSTVTINNAKFYENTAQWGGGMVNLGTATLTNCIFKGNKATTTETPSDPFLVSAGGLLNGGPEIFCPYIANLYNVSFIDNEAYYAGGGMVNIQSNAGLFNVVFTGNTAQVAGGALANMFSSPNISNALFSGNVATGITGSMEAGVGGAIANQNNANPTLVNVTIAGNTAAIAGGGVYNITDVYPSQPVIYNSIIWGNTAMSGYYNDFGGSLTADASIIGDTESSEDPKYVDAAGGVFRLQSDSSAIDAGQNSYVLADTMDIDGDDDTSEGVPYDLLGYDRIVGGTVDMGAYEFDPAQKYYDIADLITVLKILTGGNPVFTLDDIDANEDGVVDLKDAAKIIQHLVWLR